MRSPSSPSAGGTAPPELVAALVKALGSPGWGDRRIAALALGRLGFQGRSERADQDGGRPVELCPRSGRPRAGDNAAALDALLALSRDEVPQVRAAAAHSLRRSLKDDRAHKRRGELVSDPDPAVRAAAGTN